MTVTICKSFDFDAAHRLDRLPEHHKCHRLHGHTYKVELRITAELDARGMVIDYDELATVWAPVHEAIDHRYLNDVPGLEIPTTEVLAAWIYERVRLAVWACLPRDQRGLAACLYVRVYESSTTWAEYGA